MTATARPAAARIPTMRLSGPRFVSPARPARARDRHRHRPDRPGHAPPTRPRCGVWLAARARRDRRLPAPDRPDRVRADPQPPDEPDDVEALEAALPVAREPVGVRPRLPRRPHREPDPRPVRRRRVAGTFIPGPVELPQLTRRPRHARDVRPDPDRRSPLATRSSCRRGSGSSSTGSASSCSSSPGSTGSWPGPTPTALRPLYLWTGLLVLVRRRLPLLGQSRRPGRRSRPRSPRVQGSTRPADPGRRTAEGGGTR